jgi:hypothetical protein
MVDPRPHCYAPPANDGGKGNDDVRRVRAGGRVHFSEPRLPPSCLNFPCVYSPPIGIWIKQDTEQQEVAGV